MNYSLNIVHLYPDLLNLYGDKGNIECLKKRLIWRGIDANVSVCTDSQNFVDFENTDIIFVGGGSDREQEIVCSRLLEKKREISAFAENGGTIIAVCGGYQLLGKYYRVNGREIKGLEILDISTDAAPDFSRLIGNVVIENEKIGKIVGFENHGGRTDIGSHTPLGKVICGFGNDGKSGYEGVIYKNVIGTYLHGPLFPKNPKLCDAVLSGALTHKYSDFTELSPLDDSLENLANEYIVKTYTAKNS